MFQPGQLCKIITVFEDKSIPVQVCVNEKVPDNLVLWSFDTTIRFIKHGTIGMFLKEDLTNLSEIENIETMDADLEVKQIQIPMIQLVFVENDKPFKGWVVKDNVELL